MLQSVLVLRSAGGRIDELVERYRSVGIIEAAIPFGLLRGEALRDTARPDLLIVTSLWHDGAAYDSWLASEERVRVTRGLDALLDPDAPPEIHRLPVREGTDAAADLELDGIAVGRTERLHLVRPS
ncbi:antibiotic biosynthesis monooxygenase [Microbacterium sp. 18062]|uniref:antibiotic biosynthesis monooxygenase n=1 Tax=Microbacterium sp. 18062 TaxID=2681410 RepID=UPI00135B5DE8|nr:hypothetical protein [Microbacterium sp. 18062]